MNEFVIGDLVKFLKETPIEKDRVDESNSANSFIIRQKIQQF